MENDGLLIETEFDQNMFGFEAEPLELTLDISSELKSREKNLNLKKDTVIGDLAK